jgi:hypothetical protein
MAFAVDTPEEQITWPVPNAAVDKPEVLRTFWVLGAFCHYSAW